MPYTIERMDSTSSGGFFCTKCNVWVEGTVHYCPADHNEFPVKAFAPTPIASAVTFIDEDTKLLLRKLTESIERLADGIEALSDTMPSVMANLEEEDYES